MYFKKDFIRNTWDKGPARKNMGVFSRRYSENIILNEKCNPKTSTIQICSKINFLIFMKGQGIPPHLTPLVALLHLCWNHFLIKLYEVCSFIKKMLQHRCLPVSFAKLWRKLSLQNTSKWLLMDSGKIHIFKSRYKETHFERGISYVQRSLIKTELLWCDCNPEDVIFLTKKCLCCKLLVSAKYFKQIY